VLIFGRLCRVSDDLVPDSLWERIAPLLPARPERRYRFPGRKPVDDRAVLTGIVFVLRTGIGWNQLPVSVAGCSGVTCWRRVRDWTEAGVWPALHAALLAELRAAGLLDLDQCAVDASHVHALKGGTTASMSGRRRSIAGTPAPSTI
jgi:transposase